MARFVTLLPEPDSPTMPSVSPRRSVNERPETALTMPSSVGNCTARSRTSRSSSLLTRSAPAGRGRRRRCRPPDSSSRPRTCRRARRRVPPGRSCRNTESMAMKPRPSRLNTLSVITAPPTSSAMSSPNIVTIGARLARRPWRKMTVSLGQPLGAGRADVVLTHRVEQIAAHHARIDRRVQQREHGPGQDQVRGPLLRALRESTCTPCRP